MKSKTTIVLLHKFILRSAPYLFIAMLPIQLGTFFFLPFSYINGIRVDYLALSLYATDMIALIIMLNNIKTISAWVKKYWRGILFFLCLLLLNVLFSQNSTLSLFRVVKIIEFIGIYVVFSSLRLSMRPLLFSFALASCTTCALGLLQLNAQSSLQGIWYYLGERFMTVSTPGVAKVSVFGKIILRPYATFSHPNSMGGFFALIYAYVLFTRTHKSIFYTFLRTTALSLSATVILLSFSKIAFLTFALITLLYNIRRRIGMCKFCFFSSTVVLLVLGLLQFFFQGDPLSLYKRSVMIKSSIDVFLSYPFLGTGLGSSIYLSQLHSSLFSLNQPVHNVFLLLLIELGLLISIPTFICLAYWAKSHKRIIGAGCILVVVITGSFDHYWLTSQQNFLLLSVIFGQLQNIDKNPSYYIRI